MHVTVGDLSAITWPGLKRRRVVLGLIALAVAGREMVGPQNMRVGISLVQAEKPWVWVDQEPNEPAQWYDFRDVVVIVTDSSVAQVDPLTGKELWHRDLPPIESKVYIRRTAVFGDRKHVVVSRLTRDTTWYETVTTFDASNGALLANARIEDGYGRVVVDGESIRLFDHGTTKVFDHFGKPAGEDPNFQWPNGSNFLWSGLTVSYTDNEDFPLDFGSETGLRGLRLLVPADTGGTADVWSNRLMRRIQHGEIVTLDDKPASDFYGPPICADDKGIWTLRHEGDKTRIVRVLEDGTLDRFVVQPYVDGLVQWTDRGIFFLRKGKIWSFSGRAPTPVFTIPSADEIVPGAIARHGFIRMLRVKKDGRWLNVIRLDPMYRQSR